MAEGPLAALTDGRFADRLLSTLNHGALCLMISVGHRTGLFDTMTGMAPASGLPFDRETRARARYSKQLVRGEEIEKLECWSTGAWGVLHDSSANIFLYGDGLTAINNQGVAGDKTRLV